MMAAEGEPVRWTLPRLLEGLAPVEGVPDLAVGGLRLDSRLIERGELFLACPGGRGHGMDHLEGAVRRGAVAALAEPDSSWPAGRILASGRAAGLHVTVTEGLRRRVSRLAARFYAEPARALQIIGVTGTNGKTSCTQYLAQALEPVTPCGIVGTLGHGFPGRLTPGRHTTPDAVDLQAILADLRRAGARAVAMEVSSHALDQYRVEAVPFDTAVLTNLSRDHLDYHGTMDRYAAAKLRLFRTPGLRGAVVNLDDPFAAEVLEALRPGTAVVGYGIGACALPEGFAGRLVRAERVRAHRDGLELELAGSWGGAELHSPLVGRFNASNLLAVLGVLLLHGVPMDEAVGRLARVQGVPGRMQSFGGGKWPLVVVDYAHTPHALEEVLGALREHCAGALTCVFGCGGDRDRGKRPEMGAVAERLADRIVLTDDNPRSEDGDRIIEEILAGMRRREPVRVERGRGRAIRLAVRGSGPGDVVAVCGKGHEDYQILGDLRTPFSDAAEVRRALEEGQGGWT